MIIIVLLVTISILLLSLIWIAVLTFSNISIWFAIIPTSLVILAFVVWLIIRAIFSARASKKLEKSLEDEAVRPDQLADIEAMRVEFNKALQGLRASNRGSLSTIPWYIIIGPPGAGKSTALRNSGLTFPYQSKTGPASVRGVGGTRHCDWWITNEAVLLDTAGRYSTQDDDHEEWLSFLDTVRKHRPRRPINGLLLAVSLTELVGASDEQISELAKRLRERLNEITERLRSVIPVYLLITKTDLLPGFVETFGTLRKKARSQVWGFSLSGAENDGQRKAVRRRFDQLVEVLEKFSLSRMGDERKPDARERIFEFPQHFAALRESIVDLVDQVFSSYGVEDHLFLRGTFFSSGTQEGRVLDQVMNSMAKAFGIQNSITKSEPISEAKSYFLRDFFFKVLFPDRRLVRGTRQEIRRGAYFKIGIAIAILLFSAIFIFPPFVAFFYNRELVHDVEQAYSNIGEPDSPVFLEKLAPLRKKIKELESHATKGPPFEMTFGMYQGEKLLYPARSFFVTLVRNRLLKQVLRENKGLIKKYATEYATSIPPANDEFTRTYEALKLHLLLSSPREKSEPGLTEDQQQWATDKLFSLLIGNQDNFEPSTQIEIRSCIELYMYLVSKNENFGTTRDAELVTKARQTLSKAPYEDIVLNSILSDAEGPTYDLNLILLLEGTSPSIHSDKKISGPFTLRGWREKIFPKLQTSGRQDDRWVLGNAHQEQDISRIRNRYYERYIAEWESFIGSLAIEKNLKEDQQAYNLLKHLTYDDPLHKLWNGVASNVRLAHALENEAAQKTQQVSAGASLVKSLHSLTSKVPSQGVDLLKQHLLAGPKTVENHFQGFLLFGTGRPPPPGKNSDAPVGSGNLPLDRYLEQLHLVRSALEKAMADPHERPALNAAMDNARSQIRPLIESQAPKWRPTLIGFLWEPIKGIEKNDFKAVVAIANQSWCEEVLPELDKLKDYYPFSPTGPDSSLADFSKVFAPETGTIWSFVNSVKIGKQKLIERRGNRHRFAKQGSNDAAKAFSGKFLAFLDQAWDISASLFSEPSKMEVPFSVLLKPAGETISTIVFETDGVSISYAMGPEERHSLLWPNPNNPGKSMVRAFSKQGIAQDVSRNGEWSFLKLLEGGTVKPKHNNTFVASWHFNQVGGDVEIEFIPKRKEHPFRLQKFRNMEFPEGIDRTEVCPGE